MTSPPGASNSWLQLEFKGAARERELVIELCWELDTIGLNDASDNSSLSIQAFFPATGKDRLLQEAQTGLVSRNLEALVTLSDYAFDPEEWVRNWKKEFKAFEVAPDYFIHPPWTAPSKDHRYNISIEPGHAFGTGTHESTQLVLELAARWNTWPTRVLDVGTGSGILSIAVAKRVPDASIVGLDIDPMAIEAAGENLKRNGIQQVELVVCGPEAIDGTFDLVVANLTLSLFQRVSAAIGDRAVGLLIVSGFTAEQRSAVLDCYPEFDCLEVAARRGWEGLVLKRRLPNGS